MSRQRSCRSVIPKGLATMASAGVAFLVSGSAEGAVHSKTVNVPMTGDTNGEAFVLHMTAGGDLASARLGNENSASAYFGPGLGLPFALLAGDPLAGFGKAIVVVGNFVGSFPVVSRLDSGAVIGGSPFASFMSPMGVVTHATWTGTWLSGTPAPVSGYIGFAVAPDAVPPVFGWVAVTIDAVNSLTITGYGWESTPLTAIAAGAQGSASAGQGGGAGSTPEPTASGLALLAMGAAGVVRHRRHRSSAAA